MKGGESNGNEVVFMSKKATKNNDRKKGTTMKVKKNFLITVTAFLCILAMSFSASAMKNTASNSTASNNEVLGYATLYEGEFDIVAAKHQLASLHENEYVEMPEEKIQERLDTIDELLFANISEEERVQKLEELSVYILEVPTGNNAEYASDASYITLNRPVIYYNATNKYWGIYASGCYNKFPDDIDWTDVFWPTVGKRYEIGDVDCYGFVIEDAYGTYNASLKSQKCIISTNSNINYGTRVSSTTKTTGSGRYGVGFEIQDKALITESNIFNYTWTYIGYSFGCIGWYTDSFKNYRGNVQTVYGHTWSSCEVSNFTIGLEAGVSEKDGGQLTANCALTLSKASKGFKGASSDTNLYSEGFNASKKTNPRSDFNP